MNFKRIALCLVCLGLAGFTAEDRKSMVTACAASILKAQKLGRPIPPDLVAQRNAVCTCIADNVERDTAIETAEKKRIAEIYQLSTAGKTGQAALVHRKLSAPANKAMRKYTRACVRYFLKRVKTAPKGAIKKKSE